jgi:ferredoxin
MGKNLATNSKQCVACGACVKHCPIRAVTLYKGVRAVVDRAKCAGCGKCAAVCPGCIMVIVSKESLGIVDKPKVKEVPQ